MRALALTLAALALLVAAPVAIASHVDPLRGEWHLDGATAVGDEYSTPDSSGHDYSLRSPDPPSIVAGRFANAFQFGTIGRGLEGDFAPAETADLQPGTNFTLAAWVKHSGNPGATKFIAAKGADGCLGASYGLLTGPDGGLYFNVFEDDREPVETTSSPNGGTSLWDGQWHLVAGTYDGANVRVFVDGNEAGNGTPRVQDSFDFGVANHAFSIGRYAAPGCGSSAFPGAIDEVEVYSRALTGAELKTMAAAGAQPVKPPTDRDLDGITEPTDNCPGEKNPDQADTNGNGVGNACEEPLTARLRFQGPRCVGSEITFDGSASTGGPGGPIIIWTFEVLQAGPPAGWEWIEDHSIPTATHRFGWNVPPGLGLSYAKRTPAKVRLTVTNRTGTDSVTRSIRFLTTQSNEPRPAECGPAPLAREQIGKLKAGDNVVLVPIRCTSTVACFGQSILAGARVPAGVKASARRKKARNLGKKAFTVPAGKRRTVRVKLNKRGRKLLRKRRSMRVKATMTTFRPSGKAIKKSRVVKLKLPKKR